MSIEGRAGDPSFRKLHLDRYPDRYIEAGENELQLDIDTEEDYNFFKTMWFRFRDDLEAEGLVSMREYDVIESKTPGHRHVIVYLNDEVDVFDRILLQAVLGSDRRREIRNWGRAQLGMKSPVLLNVKS